MKSKVMQYKTAKAKRLSAKDGMDLMWRDHQWDNSKGVSSMFKDHVPNYSIKIPSEQIVKVRPIVSRG